MELVVLGSGTGIPRSRRNAPGYFLYLEPFQMLVDLGSGILRQLAQIGRSYSDLDAVWLTHLHPDHISDLLPLVHALKLPDMERDKPLTLFGPKGLKDYFFHHIEAITGVPTGFEIKIREVTETVSLSFFQVRSISTPHTDNSQAYRFETDSHTIVFTGDTDMDPELIPFCNQAGLVVMDCSHPNKLKVEGHMCPKNCGEIAQKANVKIAVLSHIYPPDEPDGNRVAQCRDSFNGQVVLAKDFMRFDLSSDPIKIDLLEPRKPRRKRRSTDGSEKLGVR